MAVMLLACSFFAPAFAHTGANVFSPRDGSPTSDMTMVNDIVHVEQLFVVATSDDHVAIVAYRDRDATPRFDIAAMRILNSQQMAALKLSKRHELRQGSLNEYGDYGLI